MRDAAALGLMPDDLPTRLKGTPGSAKRVAWCQPMPLDEIKAVGRALKCSVNDVLLSCVAGATGQYLRSFGDNTLGKEIRAMVPVNLRPVEDAYKLGNRFGLAPVILPIGMEKPIKRVYKTCLRMGADERQPAALAGLWVVCCGGLASQACTRSDAQPVVQKNHCRHDPRARPKSTSQVLWL